jgi:hypothetical protein
MQMDESPRVVARWFHRGAVTPTGRFLGVDYGDPGKDDARESPLLREATYRGPAIARPGCQALLLCLACGGRTHNAHAPGLSAAQEVCAQMAFLLATVIRLRLFWSGGEVERLLRPNRPTRGTGPAQYSATASGAHGSSGSGDI